MASKANDMVKMSNKGQLVVPEGIRINANLNPGECFVAFPISEGVVFKKVDIPDVKMDFESLSKQIELNFQKNKIREKDVQGAIKWAKKKDKGISWH